MNNESKLIPCPTCGKQSPWSKENEFRPFCSKRCKIIDLGEWASEKRRVPGEPIPPMDEETE